MDFEGLKIFRDFLIVGGKKVLKNFRDPPNFRANPIIRINLLYLFQVSQTILVYASKQFN